MKWLEGLLAAVVLAVCVGLAPTETQAKTYTINVLPKDEDLQWIPDCSVRISYTKLDASPPTTTETEVSTDEYGQAVFTLNLGTYSGDVEVIVIRVAGFKYIVQDDTGLATGHDNVIDIYPLVEPKVMVTYTGVIRDDGVYQTGVDVEVTVSSSGETPVPTSCTSGSLGSFDKTFEVRFRDGTLTITSVEGYGSWTPSSRSMTAATWSAMDDCWVSSSNPFGDVACDP